MNTKDSPAPNPNPGSPGAVVNDDGSVTYYDSEGCWITLSGGSPGWRANNPFNLPPLSGDGRSGVLEGPPPIAIYIDSGEARDNARDLLFRDPTHDMYHNMDLYRRDTGTPQPVMNCLGDGLREFLGEQGLGGTPPDPGAVQPRDLSPEQQDEIMGLLEACNGNEPGDTSDRICPDGSGSTD